MASTSVNLPHWASNWASQWLFVVCSRVRLSVSDAGVVGSCQETALARAVLFAKAELGSSLGSSFSRRAAVAKPRSVGPTLPWVLSFLFLHPVALKNSCRLPQERDPVQDNNHGSTLCQAREWNRVAEVLWQKTVRETNASPLSGGGVAARYLKRGSRVGLGFGVVWWVGDEAGPSRSPE